MEQGIKMQIDLCIRTIFVSADIFMLLRSIRIFFKINPNFSLAILYETYTLFRFAPWIKFKNINCTRHVDYDTARHRENKGVFDN